MERCFEQRDLPDKKEGLRERASAYCDLKMHREAAAEYEKIIELDKADPWSYLDLGICLSDNGEIEKAMEIYRQALRNEQTFSILFGKLPLSHAGNCSFRFRGHITQLSTS